MLQGARILVADDDPQLLDAVAESLTRRGADVVCAEGGAELIEQLAEQGPFGLVITDISMPWMNGLQAMYSARTAGLGTAVIVMTALRDERIPEQVRALGENARLLHKPFEQGELLSAATDLLAAKRPNADSSS
jgi:CheY-like chemotaxis protein